MIEIPVNMTFVCPKCGEIIKHDYTQQDLLDNEYLEFTCECDYIEKVKLSLLVDKAKEEAIKELTKQFESILYQ
jgi:RNase P subunit RPR2